MYEYPEDYRHRIIDSWGNLLINCTFYRNFDTWSGRMGFIFIGIAVMAITIIGGLD